MGISDKLLYYYYIVYTISAKECQRLAAGHSEPQARRRKQNIALPSLIKVLSLDRASLPIFGLRGRMKS